MKRFVRLIKLNDVALFTFLAIAGIVATFYAIGGHVRQITPNPSRVWVLLLTDIGLLALLAFAVGRRVLKIWRSFQHNLGASKLQKRVVWTFSLVTILPAGIISVASVVFFNLGIQAWFNERVGTAVGESLAVAQAYLEEHRENVRADALAMANDIAPASSLALTDPVAFNRMVSAQAERRHLTEVVVFQGSRIIAQGRLTFTVAFESLPANAIERAGDGEVVILDSDADKVRALARIDGMANTYLLVGRLVDPKVISHMANTSGAVSEYHLLKSQLHRLQSAFSVLFATLTLVLLLAAAWYGLVFTARVTTPLARLAEAAERVRAGDYASRVRVLGENNEITALSRTFNRMVEQLASQRSELIGANRELDERGRFSQAVLSGVSAGVLALDAQKQVTLANRSAAAVLGRAVEELKGASAEALMPGIAELLAQVEGTGNAAQGNMNIMQGRNALTLHVRVTLEKESETRSYIVTFDDITPLAAAQRHAAWSDVARRVAHEIKNPLTPIALSAERLKRKYLKFLAGEEAETFTKYTDTIARHVADIGRMVDEFVAFARMPGVQMKQGDLVQITRRVVFSEQVAHPSIRYRLECAEQNLPMECDERQLAQGLSNLLKNAAEAIESIQAQSTEKTGEISITLGRREEGVFAIIEDNGPGFPAEKIQSMLEPYVTTRARGTGLGLAIVKKIVEEHKGSLQLANNPQGGARVTLSFLQQCDINAST